MSRIVKVSESNYRLQVQAGGIITLDTGAAYGTVVITGNLDVKGLTTTVESVNTTVKDNILQINYGQTGNGISPSLNGQAGIQIGRGNYSDAFLLFDEGISHYDPLVGSTVSGTFVLKTANGNLSGLQLASIGTSSLSDFYFDMNNTTRILKVINAPNYEAHVLYDNDIPNKKFVNDYVSAHGGQADVDKFYYIAVPGQTQGKAYSNYIEFTVMGSVRSTITTTGFNVDDVNLFGDTVKNSSALSNLKLAANNNTVEVQAVTSLNNVETLTGSYDTSVVSGTTKIYSSATAGPGKTGLYISNVNTQDELVSKNRAVLLSILL